VSRVAIATCAGENVDPDAPLLLHALAHVGVDAAQVVWDEPSVDWDRYDLVVLRSTWDYATRRDEFLAWARGVTKLVNPYQVVEYSSDKHYLDDVASRGHHVVPTKFFEVGASPEFPDLEPTLSGCTDSDARSSSSPTSTRSTLSVNGRSFTSMVRFLTR
jgi:hypothetical protein